MKHNLTDNIDKLSDDLEQLKSAMVLIAKEYLKLVKADSTSKFQGDGNAAQAIKNYSDNVDQLICWIANIYRVKIENGNGNYSTDEMAIIAVGGYGRRELFLESDIDLLFLCDDIDDENSKQLTEFILYILWDIGLKVGHSMRDMKTTIALSQNDHTILTALIDKRIILGSVELFLGLQKKLSHNKTKENIRNFVKDKLAERNNRHNKWGNSRYILEPNIKDGKGTQRDLQTLYWILKYSYSITNLKELIGQSKLTTQEYNDFKKAQGFLWSVRMHLHIIAKRPEERLTFSFQQIIARNMGYRGDNDNQSVERFMKRFYQITSDISNLTRDCLCDNRGRTIAGI